MPGTAQPRRDEATPRPDAGHTEAPPAIAPELGPADVLRPGHAEGHEPPKPLDPPMLPVALAGVAIWAVATLVMLTLRDTHESWFRICVAGLLWGVPGTLFMLRYDAIRRRRRR